MDGEEPHANKTLGRIWQQESFIEELRQKIAGGSFFETGCSHHSASCCLSMKQHFLEHSSCSGPKGRNVRIRTPRLDHQAGCLCLH